MPVIPPELHRELRRITVQGGLALLVVAVLVTGSVGPAGGLFWLAAAMGCWVLVVWQCRRRLDRNGDPGGGPCDRSLGPANRVTLLRGLLIAATAGFLPAAMQGAMSAWVPAGLYTAVVLGDALDGQVARRRGSVTQLGAELDTILDALGLLVAPVLAVLYGKLPVVYLAVGLAYYLFHWGLHWRARHGRPVYPLPPSRLRRHLAGLQMVLVAAALWPPVPASISRPLAVLVMVPLLLGFWRDWMHVSGRRGGNRGVAT